MTKPSPTPQQLLALEKLIRMMRPVLFIRGGIADPLHKDVKPAFPEWSAFSERLKLLAYSVGAIFYDGSRVNPVATGFLVTPRLLMTNRHVAIAITHGSGIIDPTATRVDFEQERQLLPNHRPTKLESVVAIHSEHDLALIRLAEAPDGRQPLAFGSEAIVAGSHVAAIGYPMSDTERNPLFVNAMFDGAFGVKRAAPGEIVSVKAAAIFHDCTTLGGNSGSPILSLSTGEIVAVHREGSFLVRNEAVPASIASAFVAQHLEAA
jgi:endonuclease G